MALPKEILYLIYEYKMELEMLTTAISFFNSRYRYLNIHFDDGDDIQHFLDYTSYVINSHHLIVRYSCEECVRNHSGVWSWIDETVDMSILDILHFMQTLICNHEQICSLKINKNVTVIELNVRKTLPTAQT